VKLKISGPFNQRSDQVVRAGSVGAIDERSAEHLARVGPNQRGGGGISKKRPHALVERVHQLAVGVCRDEQHLAGLS
jgi:hypothetical protein